MSRIVVTAFKWVPPFAKGLVRDLRVRWALEEAGLPYEQKLIGPEDQASADYRALQPFGQVPVMMAEGSSLASGARLNCDVLNLVLGPLDLDLLGLQVSLDKVVLDIVAASGAGNLLGNLLCAVAGLLDAGGLLTQVAQILDAVLALLRQ